MREKIDGAEEIRLALLAPLFGFGNEKPEHAVDCSTSLALGLISDRTAMQKVLYV